VVTKKAEAVTPPATVKKLLNAGGEDLVLVGGQALAFWVDRYGVSLENPELPAISNDVDFLSRSAADTEMVNKLAKIIKGRSIFPNRRALTALVGQAVLDVSDEEFINVDVVFKIVGIEGETVRKRAVKIFPRTGQSAFLVMHPLDVLQSRLANLHKLRDKQNDKGRMQLALAIDVAREFLRNAAREAQAVETAAGRSPIQDYVSAIEKMAIDDAGRKVAARHALYVADAIDPDLIPAGPFWTKRWPDLKKLMSARYAEAFHPPSARERPPNTRPAT
jgi:hypothetical protein